MRARVAQRLAIPIVVPVRPRVTHATAHVARSTWKALVAKGTLVVALGGSVVAGMHHVYGSRAAIAHEEEDRATIERTPSALLVIERPTPSAPIVAHTRSTSAPKPNEESAATLEAEHRVLDEAHAAVVAGDYDKALAATAEHAARFPKGMLAEEREAIAIRALARLGRTEEARARLDKLRASHPQSFLLEGATEDVNNIP